jgi:GDP-L-fucose synthase
VKTASDPEDDVTSLRQDLAHAQWNYSGSRILVTGATGLIGRELTERLLARGAKLRTTSRRVPPPEFPLDHVEHCIGDLTDRNFAQQVSEGIEGLFHLAGRRGSIGIQCTRAATMLGENMMICFNVLDAARRAGVTRVLYTSTVTVYPPMPIYREDQAWSANPHPGDQYAAWAKRMAEKFIEAQEIEYGDVNTAIVRPVNTFGPYDDFDPETALVVPALIGRALSGANPFVVWGDGSAVRDFLYVSDAVDGILLAFERGVGKGAFNLGSGHGSSIKDVVAAVIEATGYIGEVKWDITKPAGEPSKVADITRARQILGFEPKVDLKTAILRTTDWYRHASSQRASRTL